jgi:carbonic anhydrase/acetyltransferase-like protein (isoleucine patch superfamily)
MRSQKRSRPMLKRMNYFRTSPRLRLGQAFACRLSVARLATSPHTRRHVSHPLHRSKLKGVPYAGTEDMGNLSPFLSASLVWTRRDDLAAAAAENEREIGCITSIHLLSTVQRMTLYKLGSHTPTLDNGAFVAPGAMLIGKVSLGQNASVWFGAILRGDNEAISIGPGSNVQDGVVMHTDPGFPLEIGANVTVGHRAVLHGSKVADDSLIGMQATILNGAVIGRNCIVGAGALVTERKVFPDGYLILGAPAKIARELTEAEQASILDAARVYVRRSVQYHSALELIPLRG